MIPLGEVRSDNDLHRVLRARAEELSVTREAIDLAAGLTSGHTSKLLAPKQIKRFGAISRWLLLQALGLKLVVVEDADATLHAARMMRRRVTVRNRAVQYQFSVKKLRKMGRQGGLNSRKGMSKRKASTLGRRAAKARWAKSDAAAPCATHDRAGPGALPANRRQPI